MGTGRWVGEGEGLGGRVKGGEGGRNVRRESGDGKIGWGGTGREKGERIKGGGGEWLLRERWGGRAVEGVEEGGRGEGRGKGLEGGQEGKGRSGCSFNRQGPSLWLAERKAST